MLNASMKQHDTITRLNCPNHCGMEDGSGPRRGCPKHVKDHRRLTCLEAPDEHAAGKDFWTRYEVNVPGHAFTNFYFSHARTGGMPYCPMMAHVHWFKKLTLFQQLKGGQQVRCRAGYLRTWRA